jgi:glutamine cyclotransferase
MNNKHLIIAVFFAACHHTETSLSNSNTLPAALNYTVTNVYPHDSTSFTEGLEWQGNTLYESSGEYGISSLMKINLINGKPLQKITLENKYFGEGITILNGKIYQLTYKEGKCFVYDLKTLKKLKEFNYEGQGWGMTNDGKYLIMDDSTETLTYRDPVTFEGIKK